ncbi:hypothetical protein EIJ81_06155 [Aliivibrio salmonicida]|jgi:hypothetical protein|uniref:hypothetical protein n=1 Tax=Aliivibrio salmonicida TaxID=40269 RepID=UPI000F6BE2C8|nr:hypothetical protein [Aliivibrio salmonicida]AZL84264.1 hypothetical protein EIJ81_06155 [Aliivibrio salmonicida]
MPIRFVLITIVALVTLLVGVYREGYNNGFSMTMNKIQTQHLEQINIAIKKANTTINNDKRVIREFMTKQTDFIKRVETNTGSVLLTQPHHNKEEEHEQQSSEYVVGIDADELRELQRLTHLANTH